MIVSRIDRLKPEVREKLHDTVARAVERLKQQVLATKLAGKPLRATRGPLHDSIQADVIDAETSVIGEVRVQGAPEAWAGVHEYGGAVRVPAYVRHGHKVSGYTYEARRRSFLASALGDLRSSMSKIA